MATAMGTVPAPSEANRCWRLCGSRGRQLAVASAKGTGHVYLTGGPEGGISGVGQAAWPCYRGLRLFLTVLLPAFAFSSCVLPPDFPKVSAFALGIRSTLEAGRRRAASRPSSDFAFRSLH